MFLFYAPVQENGRCRLSESESRHCAKVLRLLPGEEVWITDGKGFLYGAELSIVNDKACMARVKEVLRSPGEAGNVRPGVHVVMAPTKNMERTEWFLEKATEVGLGGVSFIRTEHSERKVVKEERVEALLVSAMKQSQQAYLPVSGPMCGLDEFLSERLPVLEKDYPQKFIAYCGKEYPKNDYLELLRPGTGVQVMIGPEGDFSPEEVDKCVEKGYVPVSLGSTRLRTETAALFAAWAPSFIKGK